LVSPFSPLFQPLNFVVFGFFLARYDIFLRRSYFVTSFTLKSRAK
jgi:hypothetical protein